MLDFLIDLAAEIGMFFAELWMDKIVGRFKKKREKNEEQSGADSDPVSGSDDPQLKR